MAIIVDNFIGSIVSGHLRNAGTGTVFDAERVLGTAFVVNPSHGIVLTCDHVLPRADRDSGRAFAFYTMSGGTVSQPLLIDCASAVQWERNDLIALKILDPRNLVTYPIDADPITLAEQVVTIGLPLDHLKSTPHRFVITPRAIVSHIVSGYPSECETDKPFITTMSGSPVFRGDRIVGVCYLNREYALNRYLTEKIDTIQDATSVRTERYEYSEVSRFGVFYTASSWHSWASSLMPTH
jgi:hypothetical protein